MKRCMLLWVIAFLIGARIAVNAQELTVSDIEFIDEGSNHEHPLIILTKEGSALNVQLMNYSAHPYTEEFVITPKMSGGSDGEPCSVSIGVSYINHSISAIITTFNVSFNVHGIEDNSFYFSCWWYKGMVSLTEGEPLELWENKNISKDGVTYTLDNKTKTATLSSGRYVEGVYNIPSELDYGGQAFTLTSINYPAFAFNTSLTSVIIPKSVTNIGNAVFYRCSNLTDVYCYAENVPETGINVFNDSPITSATLHVPAVSVDKYKAAEPWNGFGKYIAVASDVQNSGCVRETRADAAPGIPTITLLKEGNILTVNLLNYISNCATLDFEVTPSIESDGNSITNTVSIQVRPIVGDLAADCICPYNISFTVHDVKANSFYFNCWWYKGQVNLTDGEQMVLSKEYYPEGTKWTEIRLDTLKYDSWYTRVGDEWIPNYETIEYYVKGEYENKNWSVPFKCVYTNSPEWTDSLTLLLYEGTVYGYDMGVLATVPNPYDDNLTPLPGEAYIFDWNVGMTISFVDILSNNTTAFYPPGTFDFGKIEEIKEGNFGGVRPLKYTDVNGVRIIQGIGVTTWNDGECLFGPVKPYYASPTIEHNERHYRSMLVHFERNGEVLYNVWPVKGSTVEVAINNLNYFLNLNTHEAILTVRHTCSGEVDIPSEVNYNGETFIVKSMNCHAFYENKEITKVKIPKTLAEIIHYYPFDPDLQDPPTGMVNPIYMNPFRGCTALESIEVDEENPNFKSINGVLYSQDDGGQFRNTIYSGTGLFCYPQGIRQESYTIPDGVKFVFGNAFYQNKDLTTLILPSSTKAIYDKALCGCTNLKDVYCYAENAPVGYYVFENTPIASATLHVPASSVDEYKKSSTWKDFGNIVALPNPVTFTEGQMATIILPTTPDASKGKYYRLDRCEEDKIVFEEELHPKARVPYIIMPKEDFTIDLSTLDLAGLSQDTVTIKGISFIGSYTSEELESKEGWYVDIIDTTPDCSLSPSGETEKGAFRIGALRAYLSWEDPYSQGPTKGEPQKKEIVLHDNPNGISEELRVKSEESANAIYDLSGRKVNAQPNSQFSIFNSQLKKGLYIVNGKRVVVK